jgi:hypothetical protein
VTDLIVRRWARYGHERLYAETPGGTALGYLDVKTGRFHTDDLANMPLLEKAIADHLEAQQPAPGSSPAAEPPSTLSEVTPDPTSIVSEMTPDEVSLRDGSGGLAAVIESGASATGTAPEPTVEPTPAPAWDDISGTRAGAAARERALAEREAAGSFRTVVSRLFGVKTDERAWRIGADGEEAVAAQLTKLGPEWRVLHAVRVGERGSDIDHVAIGPGGVFTVNAKHHPHTKVWVGGDTFIVGGHRVDYIRNSRHEARRAGRLLAEHVGFPVSVSGVIAVMGAHDGFVVKEQPRDGAVHIVQRKRISQ